MEKIRFPESEEASGGSERNRRKGHFGYCTELYPDVEYAEHSGRKLHLQIMTPLVYGKRSEMAADRICTGIFLA